MVSAKLGDESKRVVAKDVGDTAVEALDHAVGLWCSSLGQAMLNAERGTDYIEQMVACGFTLAGGTKAVGELFAVIGEDFGDLNECFCDQAFEEASGGECGLIVEYFHVDLAGRPVNAGEEIFALVLVGHLGQILHIHMDEAQVIVPDPLMLWILLCFGNPNAYV
jgi:hypothetical protein